ncbi:MAG: hypothetical protein IKM43_03915 [Clostridia bacterium]|nr:hypothetical protein [Clostridia bacterium]
MFKKKELEFNINGNILEVADFTWHIDRVNMIYIAPSCMCIDKWAIYVETDNEIDKLYFESDKSAQILNNFRHLCNAIRKENPNFKIHGPRCFNFTNVKDIESSEISVVNMVPQYLIRLIFKNGKFKEFKALDSELRSLIADKEEIEQNNGLQQ